MIFCERVSMVYFDDIAIFIFTRTWEEHLAVLDDVLQRLRAAGLTASPSKCAFDQEELLYLGHLVTREGILLGAKKRAMASNCHICAVF